VLRSELISIEKYLYKSEPREAPVSMHIPEIGVSQINMLYLLFGLMRGNGISIAQSFGI
jgi:hypothetical protein